MTSNPTLAAGQYTLLARCPECKAPVALKVGLFAALAVEPGKSVIRAKLSTKAQEHTCEHVQDSLFDRPTDGGGTDG